VASRGEWLVDASREWVASGKCLVATQSGNILKRAGTNRGWLANSHLYKSGVAGEFSLVLLTPGLCISFDPCKCTCKYTLSERNKVSRLRCRVGGRGVGTAAECHHVYRWYGHECGMFRGSVEMSCQFIGLRLKLNFDVVEYLVLDVQVIWDSVGAISGTATDSGLVVQFCTHRT
jgi:hypothetical protein